MTMVNGFLLLICSEFNGKREIQNWPPNPKCPPSPLSRLPCSPQVLGSRTDLNLPPPSPFHSPPIPPPFSTISPYFAVLFVVGYWNE